MTSGTLITQEPAPAALRPAAPERRVNFLDGIRGVAAIYVVFGHILATVWNPFQGGSISGRYSWVTYLPSAHWSVTVFILLSGFCLALPLVRGKPLVVREYFIRRAIRIVPAYWFTLLISSTLILFVLHNETGTVWDLSRTLDAPGLISHFFLIHNAVGQSNSINYPLWSVGVEWQIYFMLPLLWAAWKWTGPAKTTCAVMLAAWLVAHLLRHSVLDGMTAQFYGVFAFGMLLAHWTFSPASRAATARHAQWFGIAGIAALLLTATFAAHLSEYDRTRYARWFDAPVAIGSGLLILAAGGGGAAWFRVFFSWTPLTWVGGFSYTLYLLHAPLLQLSYLALRKFTPDQNHQFLALVFAGIPLIVLASFLLSLAIERPFLHILKNRKSLREARV